MNTEREFKNRKPRETGNIGYRSEGGEKRKQKQKIICLGYHYAQRNTNNITKTRL